MDTITSANPQVLAVYTIWHTQITQSKRWHGLLRDRVPHINCIRTATCNRATRGRERNDRSYYSRAAPGLAHREGGCIGDSDWSECTAFNPQELWDWTGGAPFATPAECIYGSLVSGT